ncbi:MAG TPA: DJ-1/PfpI family protein [Bryobacteraceae bacterium]|nr:DJ-1/PfpI family protein [Bryobacteraceae bacterium]
MKNSFTRRQLAAIVPGIVGAAAFPRSLRAQKIIPLKPPEKEGVPVAIMISENAVVMDFCGPIAVFEGTNIPSRGASAFNLYTVAESTDPVEVTGGLKIVPSFSFVNAPQPKVILIPEQQGSDAMVEWIKTRAKDADMTMSVCTGAFLLAKTGLLKGKTATTHHGSFGRFGMTMKEIRLKRGYRFVDEGKVATSGGLSCGMDLALHVVERYYGRQEAENAAFWLEYQGDGWKDISGASNSVYAKRDRKRMECPICTMPVDATATNKSDYKGKTYYLCSGQCKARFEGDPEGALEVLRG